MYRKMLADFPLYWLICKLDQITMCYGSKMKSSFRLCVGSTNWRWRFRTNKADNIRIRKEKRKKKKLYVNH